MAVPMAPELELNEVIFGGVATVKVMLLLATPPTVTVTGPVVAANGTGTTIFVALQLVGTAVNPLKAIVLLPWVAPKFAPVTVTEVLARPRAGERLMIPGT